MENLKTLVYNNKDNLKYALFLGALLAAFNCLAKPDYNLVSYLYIYYVWHQIEDKVTICCVDNTYYYNLIQESQSAEKLHCFYFLSFSMIIDIIWVIFWNSQWGLIKNDSQSFIHSIVIIISWIGIALKVILYFFTVTYYLFLSWC